MELQGPHRFGCRHPVLDPVEATRELDSVLERGARLIVLRPGPANGRSPADCPGTRSGPGFRRPTSR